MGNSLYIIAIILIIGWLVGLLVFHAGGIVHVLPGIALILIILRVVYGRKAI